MQDLRRLLDDGSGSVRGQAVIAIVRISSAFFDFGRTEVEWTQLDLIAFLWDVRRKLREIDGADVLEVLLQEIDAGSPERRAAAMSWVPFLNIRGSDAVGALIRPLSEGDERERAAAANALGVVGAGLPESYDALVKALSDKSRVVARMAGRAISTLAIEEQRLPSALVEALQAPKATTRLRAIETLELSDALASGAVASLTRLLQDPSRDVRRAALFALGRLGAAEAIPGLARLVSDSGETLSVRTAAAASLEAFGPRASQALPTLVDAVKDLGAPAIRAVAAIEPDDERARNLLEGWIEVEDAGARLEAAIALARVDPENARAWSVLVDVVEHGDIEAVARVATTLGPLLPAADVARRRLSRWVASPDDKVRVLAARAIWAAMRDPEPAVSRLIEILEDPVRLRYRAAAALAEMGPAASRAVPALTPLVQEADLDTARAALRALGRIGPDARGAIEMLKLAARHPELRREALTALRRIGN